MLPNRMTSVKKPVKKHYNVSPFDATENEIGKTCSICGSGITNGESIVLCPECNLPYHHDCWKEMGGCGSYGCAAAPDIKKADYAPSDTYVEGWTSEKRCPECGSMIMSNAIICRVCKAEFPTEKPMTKEEWQNRTYDGKELESVRVKLFLQSFFSFMGCFAIFSFPINLFALFTDNWVFKVKRLPKELKILHYTNTVVSGLWLIVVFLYVVNIMVN
ncbi:MAG: hypothetical protein J6Z11_13420 [Candidatus Riflebacteria bacterium]|nr:hypothetical protein [Candidatus Riflebacteria bacterium]